MINFIIQYWLQFLFGLIISFGAYIYKKTKEMHITFSNTKSSICVLLKNEILKQYLFIKKNKDVTIYDKEIINDLYTEYKKLGGNSFIKDLVDDINDDGGD